MSLEKLTSQHAGINVSGASFQSAITRKKLASTQTEHRFGIVEYIRIGNSAAGIVVEMCFNITC